MKKEGKTLNETLMYYGELKNFEKALRTKDGVKLLSILHAIGFKNYDMSDVDFILRNAKTERLSFFEKIRNFFRS